MYLAFACWLTHDFNFFGWEWEKATVDCYVTFSHHHFFFLSLRFSTVWLQRMVAFNNDNCTHNFSIVWMNLCDYGFASGYLTAGVRNEIIWISYFHQFVQFFFHPIESIVECGWIDLWIFNLWHLMRIRRKIIFICGNCENIYIAM